MPQSTKHTAQAVSTRVTLHSAQRLDTSDVLGSSRLVLIRYTLIGANQGARKFNCAVAERPFLLTAVALKLPDQDEKGIPDD
jgi:hypothetical protein